MHRRSTPYDRYTDDRNYRRTPPNQQQRNPPYKTYERHEIQQQSRREPNYYKYEQKHYQHQPQHYRNEPNYAMNRNENVATNYSYFDGFEREYDSIEPTQYRRRNRRKRECYPQTPSPPIPAPKYPYYDRERHRSENTNNSFKQTSEYSDMKSELVSLKTKIDQLNALKAMNNNTNNKTNNDTNNAMAAELNFLKMQIESLKELKATQINTNSVNNNKNSVFITKKLQNRIDSVLHSIISEQSCAQRKIEKGFKLQKNEILIVLDTLCKQQYVSESNGKYYLNPKYKKKNIVYNNNDYLRKLQKRFGDFFNKKNIKKTKKKKKKRKMRKRYILRAPPKKKQKIKILEIQNNVIANSLMSINNANNEKNANIDDENKNNVDSLDDLFSSQTKADIQQPQQPQPQQPQPQQPQPQQPQPPPPPPRPKSPEMIQYQQRLDILRDSTNNTVSETISDSDEASQSDSSESSQSFILPTDSDSDSYESGTDSEVHSDSSLASTLSFHSSDFEPAHPPNNDNTK